MDDRVQDILNNLPEKPPRSSLESCRELIHELRRRGRTYREIAHLLAERCQLRVSTSTVFRFVRMGSREKEKSASRRAPKPAETKRVNPTIVIEDVAGANATNPEKRALDEVQQRIAALKLRPTPTQSSSEPFRYDPDKPLRLSKKTVT